MEHTFDRKVFLETFVKVRSNWREDPGFLSVTDWRR
jgi:GTPase Era involved in 16S rRNA processing